jgi:transcriptional regulator with XRE-family HTH domain
MPKNYTRVYSRHTKSAVQLLSVAIAIARKEQRLSETAVAEKINVSRSTIQRIENGDLKVGIGLYFEAAGAVGIKILAPDDELLKQQLTHNKDVLRLLPKSAQPSRKVVDDNF